jgi:hypothetical protein
VKIMVDWLAQGIFFVCAIVLMAWIWIMRRPLWITIGVLLASVGALAALCLEAPQI